MWSWACKIIFHIELPCTESRRNGMAIMGLACLQFCECMLASTNERAITHTLTKPYFHNVFVEGSACPG